MVEYALISAGLKEWVQDKSVIAHTESEQTPIVGELKDTGSKRKQGMVRNREEGTVSQIKIRMNSIKKRTVWNNVFRYQACSTSETLSY